tara:strand:- start:527 stop:1252 length:726 start_codon:yes stop_codon:yes gene_type:complete
MKIIPAIDIIEGKCVRLSQGIYQTKKIYSVNPLEMAKKFYDHGIRNIHLVDLDGARSSKIINYKVLESIASKTDLSIDFGGGLKSEKDVEIAFNSGAEKITIGSIAIEKPKTFQSWLLKYGGNKIILGADVKNKFICINGWIDKTNHQIYEFINYNKSKGVEYVICTDIEKDGMLNGPSFKLYQSILKNCNIKLIGSGGISKISDIEKLSEIGCHGAIIGKSLYEKKISLKDIKKYIIAKC